MNDDLDKLMELVDTVKDLSEATERATNSQNNNVDILIQLGKYVANLEHQVEQLEEENIYLRAIIKQQFGGNT